MAWPTLDDSLITTEVRRLLNEPVARRISDAQIVRWINEGVQLIWKNNFALQSTITVTIVNDQYEYSSIATDVIAIRAVLYTGTTTESKPGSGAKALLKMHPRHMSNIRASTAGPPQEYQWFKERLLIWPLPNVASNKLTVFYYKALTTIGADDLQTLPLHYAPILIWYSYSEALKMIEKYEQAVQYRSYFDNFLNFHRNNDNLDIGVDSKSMMGLPDHTQLRG